jgi:hypothetical protein
VVLAIVVHRGILMIVVLLPEVQVATLIATTVKILTVTVMTVAVTAEIPTVVAEVENPAAEVKKKMVVARAEKAMEVQMAEAEV